MDRPFDYCEKDGILDVIWIINKFHLGKFQISPVFMFNGRHMWLSINRGISKYFDVDKLNIYLEEEKPNCRYQVTFRFKGSISNSSENECFCERDIDMPFPKSRKLLGTVYRKKVMTANSGFSVIWGKWDKLKIMFSEAEKSLNDSDLSVQAETEEKLENRQNDTKQNIAVFKELTISEDEARMSEDKMSDFARETNLPDEEMAKLEEMQNMVKETKESMTEMRGHIEEDISKENQELSEKDLEEMHNEENTSPALKLYSLLYYIAAMVLKFESSLYTDMGKTMIMICNTVADACLIFEKSPETVDINYFIHTHFKSFIP